MGTRYSQLSLDERCEIYRLHADGKSLGFVAKALGRSKSTISRELCRNSGRKVGYTVAWAMIQTRARRRRKLYKMERSSPLRDMVLDLLAMGWSPEQVAGRLEREHGKPVISAESIYRYVYWRVNSHKENLHRLLPRGKYQRGWRGRKGGSSARYIEGRVSIHERPETVGSRTEAGHWEADLMLFRKYGQAVLVAQERVSRLLLASRQPNKGAQPVAQSLIAMLGRFKPEMRRSITFDNGSEFSQHMQVRKRLHLKTWFCDTHSPWQKGGVENAIGRMRRRLPRKSDLAMVSQEDFDDMVLAYNMTPRKCLGFLTPAEAFFNVFNRCCT